MGTREPNFEDYNKIYSVKPIYNTDGSPCNWVTVTYVRSNPPLSTKGCISASGGK